MFISQDEADARLNGDRNLLKDKSLKREKKEGVDELTPTEPTDCDSGEDDREKEVVDSNMLGMWEEPEVDAIQLPSFSRSSDSLEELEKLIASSHRGLEKRASYKGKREAQKALAETDALLGPSVTSNLFGLSASQAQAYGDGLETTHTKTGREDKVIKQVRDHVERVKLDIAIKATSRLNRVVACINGPRIDAIENPLDLARLGKDLAIILEKVTPHELIDPDRGTIHVYRPEVAQTQEYNIVNINVGARKSEALDDKEQKFLARTLAPDILDVPDSTTKTT